MNAIAPIPLFAVRCIKHDGVRRVEFKRYTDRAKAEADVAGLHRIGIEAEIVELEYAVSAERNALS